MRESSHFHSVRIRSDCRPSGMLVSHGSAINDETTNRTPDPGLPCRGAPIPIRIFTGATDSVRRAQPGAHTPATMTTTTTASERQSSVSTKERGATIIGRIPLRRQRLYRCSGYDFATGGSSRIQGHTAIVLTLPLLFLITVIFIANST